MCRHSCGLPAALEGALDPSSADSPRMEAVWQAWDSICHPSADVTSFDDAAKAHSLVIDDMPGIEAPHNIPGLLFCVMAPIAVLCFHGHVRAQGKMC